MVLLGLVEKICVSTAEKTPENLEVQEVQKFELN